MDRTLLLRPRYDTEATRPLMAGLASLTAAPMPIWETGDTLPLVIQFVEPAPTGDALEAITLEEGDTIAIGAKLTRATSSHLFSLSTFEETTLEAEAAYTGLLDLTTIPATAWQGRPSLTVPAYIQVRDAANTIRFTRTFTLQLNRGINTADPTGEATPPYLDTTTADGRYLAYHAPQTLDEEQRAQLAANGGLLRSDTQALTPAQQIAVRANLMAGLATLTGNTAAPYISQTAMAEIPIAEGNTASAPCTATGLFPGMVVNTPESFAPGTTIESISGIAPNQTVTFSTRALSSGHLTITASYTLALNTFHPATPGTIGATTPAAATFTTLNIGATTAKFAFTSTTLTQTNSSGVQVLRALSTGKLISHGGFEAANNETNQRITSTFTTLTGYDEFGDTTFSLSSTTGAATLTTLYTSLIRFPGIGGLYLYAANGDPVASFADDGELVIPSIDVNVLSAQTLYLATYTITTGGNLAFGPTGRALANAASTGAAVSALTVPVDTASTAITLDSTHSGTILRCTATAAVTITVPTGLPAGFSLLVIQAGAGQITFTASGTTINSFGALVKTAGQHAAASLLRVAANTFNLSGLLA